MSEQGLAEQLAQARAELERARVQAEAFTYLSHELRTLLGGVVGITSLLLDTEMSVEQRDYVKRIRGSGDAIQALLHNVLDYSRMEAKKIELDRVDLDVRRMVDEVGEFLAERAHSKGLELVVAVPALNLGALRGDPTRVRQVLINLVSNAIKFTDQGEVILRVAGVDDAGDSVAVRFEVSDTGVGIGPEGQALLFRPFSQVHHHPERAYGGSGLGLALAKRLVEAMGGSIGVRSQPDKGSTFFCTVRLERRAAPPTVGAIPRVDVAGRRVLIAAQNEANRRSLREMVEPLGVECTLAAEGETALLLLRDRARAGRPFDVAIVDASLTDVSGGALVRSIRDDERLDATRIVAMRYPGQRLEAPGHEGAEVAEELAADYLFKPVRLPALHACLLRLMGSSSEQITATGRAAELKDEGTGSASARRRSPTGPRLGEPPPPSSGSLPKTPRGTIPVSRTPLPAPSAARAGSGARPALEPSSARSGPIPMPTVSLADAVRRSLAIDEEDDTRPRVLLVEDNAVNQRIGVVMVEKRGYRVDVAVNGFEAIEAATRNAYAAVLMDCQMPKLDGYSATGHIRRREGPARRTPIIAMTADAGPGAREKCLAAGMDDYIAKPIAGDELDRLLAKWAPRRAGQGPHSQAPSSAPETMPAPPIGTGAQGAPSSRNLGTPAQRLPPIDLSVLAKLRAMRHGDPDLVLEVIDLFLQDAPERLASLRDGIARSDFALVARVVHTLKGSAGHLGAKPLASLCGRVEDKARAGAPFNTSFALSSIEEEVGRVRDALLAEASRLRGVGAS